MTYAQYWRRFFTLTIKRHILGKYYFVADAKPFQLVTNLPGTNKNKPQCNVLLFDAWGCVSDLMLWEFGLNLNPDLGWVLGHQRLFVLTLCFSYPYIA